ncbi:MAG: transcriptional repressor LexA [Bdellovibrionota bacterium]
MPILTNKLTATQSKALDFIRSSIESYGTAPTLRELCEFMGYSAIGSAQDIVAALRKKGFLQTPDKQQARSLTLSEKALIQANKEENAKFDPNTLTIHCLGQVPAGNPIEAVGERIGTLRMSISMFAKPHPSPNSLFAVQASGQSMVDCGILDGDWLVVKEAREASEGDIVVARVGGDATVKRLMKDQEGWYLKPENPSYKDIRASEDEPFEVIGKVVALQRTL